MSDEIDFFLGVCRPEIDGEDEVRGIDVIYVQFLVGTSILNHKSDTRRWCDRPSVLVSESTHASPDRLLNNIQAVYPAIDHCTRRGRF